MIESKCKKCKKPLSSGKICGACQQKTIDKRKPFVIGAIIIGMGVVVKKTAPSIIKKTLPSIVKLLKK